MDACDSYTTSVFCYKLLTKKISNNWSNTAAGHKLHFVHNMPSKGGWNVTREYVNMWDCHAQISNNNVTLAS